MQLSRVIFLFLFSFGCFTSFGQTNSNASKSVITILNPGQGTVWNIPETVTLEWNTVKIDTSKSIRFFLVRNEMVVQELGSFKNTGFKDGIELAKNIGSGNRYQVVAIELFPDDKFNIAKKVTPFFSIINKASDERKKKQQLANANPNANKSTPKKSTPQVTKETEIADTTPTRREAYNGRKISYTQEMEFNSEEVIVKIWDHGRQDGDIVSIFLNGEPVISKYHLTYNKKKYNIKLDPSKDNDLFLYAHNLGTSPPNTVSIEISDNTKSENIILNSDLKSCEAVMISVR